MKKLLLSSLIVTSIVAFAYTQVDVDNANFLAEKNVITKQTDEKLYRLDSTITRAEAVGIALKFKGIELPEGYVCKKYFSDVVNNDWICRAVEIAADMGFVSRSNTTYRPQANITRAESLAMIYQASNLEAKLPADWQAKLEAKLAQEQINLFYLPSWQGTLIKKSYFLGIIDKTSLSLLRGGIHNFGENWNATRADVFKLTRNTYNVRALMSGEVTVQ